MGRTQGYRFHPQLDRFRQAARPGAAIATYLWGVHEEAALRGYRFDASKIAAPPANISLPVTRGQLLYELEHLKAKLRRRDPARLQLLSGRRKVRAHPLFRIVPGSVEPWERIQSSR